MSILINKDTRVVTQGITGKTGQFHTKMSKEYANGANCYVAGVNPKKAGEDLRGHPDLRVGEGSQEEDRRQYASVIYVPPAFAAAAIWEAVEAELDLVICITEGIPVRDMVEVKRQDAQGGRRPPVRPELPRRHHAGRGQDRHHARPHPHEGPHRRGVALRHADLRGGGSALRPQARPVDGGGHRRRPGERPQAQGRAGAVHERPGHRRRHHDRRDRRLRRGSRRRVVCEGT
jgi:hypothetical protein